MTVEAWVLGVHNLPPELMAYGNDLPNGMVLVRDKNEGHLLIRTMTFDQFHRDYDWVYPEAEDA